MDGWGAATLLVPGDPVSVDELGRRLLQLAAGFLDAAERVGLVQANTWTGAAAEAFGLLQQVHADAFVGAAGAFGPAGMACRAYARTLADAQVQAGQAVHLHAVADAATQGWSAARALCRQQLGEAAQTHGREVCAPALTVLHSADPGAPDRARAEILVLSARQQVAAAAGRAAGELHRCAEAAPRGPAVHGWFYRNVTQHWLDEQDGIAAAIGDAAVAGWQSSAGGMAWALTHGDRLDPSRLPDVLDPRSQADRLRTGTEQAVDAPDWQRDRWRAIGYTSTNAMLATVSDGTGDGATAALDATGRRLSWARRAVRDDTGAVSFGGAYPKVIGGPRPDFAPSDIRTLPDRRTHILDGDPDGPGGGHRAGTGRPGKSEFPASWSEDKIMAEIESVAQSPDEIEFDAGSPPFPDRYLVLGARDGVHIKVVLETDGRIVSGYPVHGPGVVRNPW